MTLNRKLITPLRAVSVDGQSEERTLPDQGNVSTCHHSAAIARLDWYGGDGQGLISAAIAPIPPVARMAG